MGETTQPSLLVRVRNADDQTAWREFEAKYRELVLRYCLRHGLQPADCDDVQQLVWINLAKGLRQFEYDPQKGRFRDYLGRVVRNSISRHFSRPERAQQALDTRVLAAVAEESGGRDEAWEREWVDHHYRLAMATVRASHEARSLEVFEGLLAGRSVQDVALSHGMSEQAVHKVKQRIRGRMQELIARQIAEEDGFDDRRSSLESAGPGTLTAG